MKFLNVTKKQLLYILLAIAFIFVMVAVVLRTSSIDTLKHMSPQRQQDPFYRTQEELMADGVEIIALSEKQTEAIQEIITEFYSTTYREEYRERQVRSGRSPGLVDSAEGRVWSYSQPRTYEGLNNIVGIFALGGLYSEERGSFAKSPRLFFFTIDVDDSNVIKLKKSSHVGEDVETYERAPVESFKKIFND